MAPTPEPTTADSRFQPVSLANACPATSVSQETRLSFPSRCSTTTRIASAIFKPFWNLLGNRTALNASHDQQRETERGLNGEPDRINRRTALDTRIHER